ncbi:hypothetical protein MLP_30790 [Microlunatus phosphovorus NM-1]|uniref:Uncharacterized protein n=1 Tax=Microlunatus phosphovorus (strain ATCC 700054 / DSM 10555 / JCM 9379 / NBRC 101784 / NCIMB 13414 / VKM Ac-1990 / NM-1) TaxID=1032480 RepID=F5XKM1_MICPN|nr:hypothetical protein MLP_30790 [Microlunatus phosphovorus NM-1]
MAVGTDSETSMFFAVRAGVPRSTVLTGSSRSTVGRFDGFGGSAGTPPRLPGALGRAFLLVVGCSTVAGRRAGAGCLVAVELEAGLDAGVGELDAVAGACWLGAAAGVDLTVGALRVAAGVAADRVVWPAPAPPAPFGPAPSR